jgi:hypothetical protein
MTFKVFVTSFPKMSRLTFHAQQVDAFGGKSLMSHRFTLCTAQQSRQLIVHRSLQSQSFNCDEHRESTAIGALYVFLAAIRPRVRLRVHWLVRLTTPFAA